MSPASNAVLVLAVVCLVLSCVLVAATWNRASRPLAALTVRTAGLLTTAVTLLAAGGLVANRLGDFFTTWTEVGQSLAAPPGPAPVAAPGAGGLRGAGTAPAARDVAGLPAVERVLLTGRRTGITRAVTVVLPPGYAGPAAAALRYPVVEMFPGYPGSPGVLMRELQPPTAEQAELAAGRMRPVILVLPDTDGGRADRECVDATAGARVQDDTYLALDVPEQVALHYRTLPQPAGWATAGLSTGAYCAVNLALRHPASFTAAASLSGYFRTAVDITTGRLFASPVSRLRNDDIWRLRHLAVPRVSLLLTAGRHDPDALRPLAELSRAVRPPLLATTYLTGGAHNFPTWRAQWPYVLDWLSDHLAAPSAPAAPLPGRVGAVGGSPDPLDPAVAAGTAPVQALPTDPPRPAVPATRRPATGRPATRRPATRPTVGRAG